jgi:penicillin amidase
MGFLHARERLFQMDLMRRAVSGTLSEIVGPATLPNDRLMRTLGVRRAAEADLATLPADTRAVLESYAAGVNAWIEARGRFSALEFAFLGAPKPWTAIDSLLWGKTMGLYLSGNWRQELARLQLTGQMTQQQIAALWPSETALAQDARLLPGLSGIASRLAAYLPRFPDRFTLPPSASNEWAVDGAHSATGKPLLAGDPHLGFSLPGIWYLARIDMPGAMRVGATAPGVPFLVLGHNGHIAWTFTTTGADVQDLFVETKADDGYLTELGPRPFVSRTETIAVRGQADEILPVRETRHGPVISDLIDPKGPIVALEMANLAPGDGAATGLLALNRAQSVAEAGRAAAEITSPVQNMLVADANGIGFFVTGRVPVRRSGDGAFAARGDDGSQDWTGWAQGEALPHVVAPASGRLVNANERVAPADFPVQLGRDWFGDARARRIRALLEATPHPTATDFAGMQVDSMDLVAAGLLPQLRPIAPILGDWDGRMTIDRKEPLIFNAWMQAFYAGLLARLHVPDVGGAAVAPWPDLIPYVLSPAGASLCGGDCTKLLTNSYATAMARLSGRFGDNPEKWRWGEAHQAVFAHPLFSAIPVLGQLVEARIEQNGSDSTVGRGGLRFGSMESIHGAAYRGVYDLADLDRSLFMIAPGQSGNVASPLARNFVRPWRDGSTITLTPTANDVAARIRLSP